jgi:hypothetical protein
MEVLFNIVPCTWFKELICIKFCGGFLDLAITFDRLVICTGILLKISVFQSLRPPKNQRVHCFHPLTAIELNIVYIRH